MARIGEIIGGKYEILSEVGRGKTSTLYLAKDGRQVQRYLREFRCGTAANASVGAANAVKTEVYHGVMSIIDVINGTDATYVVSEYVQGQSLKEILSAFGPQPVDVVVRWAGQIADALDALHSGNCPIAYEGICPETVFIDTDGNAILGDVAGARDQTFGNIGCAATGNGAGGIGGDVYSLGMLIRHMLIGETSRNMLPLRSYDPSIPDSLEWLVQKATQLDPSERFESCAEMVYVLANPDKFDGRSKKRYRARARIVIIMLVCAILLGIASGALLLGRILLKNSDASESEKSPVQKDTSVQKIEDVEVKEASVLSANGLSYIITAEGGIV